MHYATFQELVKTHYREHGRDLPWRTPSLNLRRTSQLKFDPYAILVSEMMLQQTQVSRVIPKYQAFLKRFPTTESLATAKLGDVLREWNGLGYNRRAKYLHQAAQQLVAVEPWTMEKLVECKGIGPNTAAAVMVYAYNQPLVFIETNIRTAYIHHFFAQGPTLSKISDGELVSIIEKTIDHDNPREWYWALMDYGSHLKATIGNAAQRSRHYQKQSAFEGSRRQLRGQIIRLLTKTERSAAELKKTMPDKRLPDVLRDLTAEGFIRQSGNTYRLW